MSVYRRKFQKSEPPVRSSTGWGRRLHAAAAAGGWLLFTVFWIRIFLRTPTAESVRGVVMVGVLLLACVLLTVIWVRHNILLGAHHAGRRSYVQDREPRWSADVLGRDLEGPGWEALREAPEVEVYLTADDRRKVYRVF